MNTKFISILAIFGLLGCAENAPITKTSPEAASETATLPHSEHEKIYQQRFEALINRSNVSGLAAYDPLKRVYGAQEFSRLPLRPEENRLITTSVINEALSYAKVNNSSSFLVWKDGALEVEYYSEETGQASLLVSKSLAKPLSVIAVGRAIAKGHIASLDQSVAQYFPEWQNTPKAKITIRHLLAMRSGLLPQGPAPTADNILNRAYLHPAHDQVIINEYPLTHVPGERYEYSNANAELIAPLIERATGTSYDEWLGQEVLTPLGAPGGEVWMNREGGTAHSGCCILLPAQTYMRLALLLMKDGIWDGERLLPEGFVMQMTSPSAQNPHAGLGVYVGSPFIARRGAANPEIDFGKTLHTEPYLADDLFLFDGNSNQVVYIIPSKDLIILRTGGWPLKDPEWDNAKLPNIILRGLQN